MKGLFLNNFNPSAVFSWPVFFFSLFWAIMTNFTDVDNNPPGNYLLRIASVTAAHLAAFAVIGIFQAVSRRVPVLVGAIAVVPTVVAASLVRGSVVFTLLNAIGHDNVDLLGYRLMGSVTNVGMSIIVTAVVVHRVRSYRESRRALLAERLRLVEVREHARGRLQLMAKKTLDDVRASITTALDLQQIRPADATADRIQHTIDEIIRPVSHRLEQEQFSWEPMELDSKAESLNWRDAVSNALSADHLYPRAIALAMTAIALSTTIRNQAPLEAVYVLGCALLGTWATLLLTRRFVRSRRTAWAEGTSMVLGAVVAGIATGLTTLPVKLDTERPFSLVVQAPLFTLMFTVFFALAGSATKQAANATERLSETTAELAWEVARLSEEYRHARVSLARALHGKVQAGMMSSLMRLRQAIRDEDDALEELVAHTREELGSLINSLEVSESGGPASLNILIADLTDTWEGIASCTITADSHTRELLESDPVVMTALGELIPELAFNAVKHGGATAVDCELELQDERTLRMVCADNGSRPSDSGRVGLGTKLLDECASSWHRTNDAKGTVTVAYVPYASDESLRLAPK
jgi:signal transduction histidine kinase